MPCRSGEKYLKKEMLSQHPIMLHNHHQSVARVLAYFPPILFFFNSLHICIGLILYQIHNLIYFLKTFCKVKTDANLLPSPPAALNFRIKGGRHEVYFILCWHAISVLHTSLKSHKNNYRIISTAFLKEAY